MNTSTSQSSILWRLVWGLAAVQASITLTWVIYKLYLAQLLTKFGFTPELAATVLIIENALAIAMEPLMGGLSDRTKQFIGTRFPFISAGVILSSAIFIAIPAIALFGNAGGAIRWLMPVLMIAWALAMMVFRAPTLALLGRCARVPELPQAASLLTLAAGAIGAVAPISKEWLLKLGPEVTFATGSIVLLAAVAVLRAVIPPEMPTIPSETPVETPSIGALLPALGLIFSTGVFVSWGSRFLMETFPKVLQAQLPTADVKFSMFWIGLAIAIAAIPAGALAVRLGNLQGMLAGIAGCILVLLLIGLVPNVAIVVAAAIALVAFLSLVNNGAVPFAISLLPPQRSGLGVGMYFGGVGAAASLFGFVFGGLGQINSSVGAIVGAIAFLVAAACIALSIRLQPAPAVQI